MNLKNSEVPDILRQVSRQVKRGAKIFRNILATQIPTGIVGKLVNLISQHEYAKFIDSYARMEAKPAVVLTYNFVCEQIAIRPRVRLIGKVKVALIAALLLTSMGVNYLESKKSEIKINGEAVLVAEDFKSTDEVAQIESEISYKESPFDFAMPVKGYISQGYHGYHRAIDIATGAVGVPIKALGRGKVEFAGYLADGKGNVVIVDHGDGLKSLYAHMGRIEAAVGNEVDSNTAIGTVGLTGRTTGAHVHLEIYDNNIAVDPAKVLPSEN